jgi:hypothetical protein
LAALSLEQKKKLLWGKKAAATAPARTNWGATEFSNDKDKDKFLKLMGAKKVENQGLVSGAADAPDILKQDKQQQVFNDLEKMYNQGLHFQLAQRGGGRGGLS